MTAFDTAFEQLVGLEGRYSDDANDPGNWTGGKINEGDLKGTMYGVSAASYPTLDIKSLSLSRAKAIYFSDYWSKLKCDALPDVVAIALFKEGVNMGVGAAAKTLQRSLKTIVDGQIGQLTIGLATSSPPKVVLAGFLGECAYGYTQMGSFKIYGRGWLNRVIKTALEAQFTPEENIDNGVKAQKV